MDRRIAFPIIALTALLQMSCHGRVETLETTQLLEEYELDLGPQGKDKNQQEDGATAWSSPIWVEH